VRGLAVSGGGKWSRGGEERLGGGDSILVYPVPLLLRPLEVRSGSGSWSPRRTPPTLRGTFENMFSKLLVFRFVLEDGWRMSIP
jgi:hypothetical protein